MAQGAHQQAPVIGIQGKQRFKQGTYCFMTDQDVHLLKCRTKMEASNVFADAISRFLKCFAEKLIPVY
jgi:hypothetical protein